MLSIFGPSLGALSGSSCVSINNPAIPTEIAALDNKGTNSLLPPVL